MPLGRLYREYIESRPSRPEGEEEVLPVYRQRYPWFFGGALLLLALAVIIPDRARRQP